MRSTRKYEDTHKIINGTEYKLCTICNEWKRCSTEFFHKNSSSKKDGLHTYCKLCHSKKSMSWNYSNYEKHKESRRKSDNNPKRKEEIYVYSKQYREDGRYSQWQKSDSGKQSVKKSQEKRKTKQHQISAADINSLYEYCNSKCMYCEITEEENLSRFNQRLTKDHAINNGSNGIENCILCCKSCSSSKKDKDWTDWYSIENKRYSEQRYERILGWLNEFV